MGILYLQYIYICSYKRKENKRKTNAYNTSTILYTITLTKKKKKKYKTKIKIMQKICNTLVELGLLPKEDLTMDTDVFDEQLPYSPSSSPSRHSIGSVSDSGDSIEYLEETAEATPMKKGSCARISAEEYERQGREYTQKMLLQLVEQMKKDQAKLGKRVLRSKAKSFNEIIKSSIWSMFSNDINKSNELSENEKVKAVEDLADKIMKTHYYYNGNSSTTTTTTKEKKNVNTNNNNNNNNNNKATATFVQKNENTTTTYYNSPFSNMPKKVLFSGIKKRKGLNDITNSGEKSKKKQKRRSRRKSINHKKNGGPLLAKRLPFNPFLADIKGGIGQSKLKKASVRPIGGSTRGNIVKPMTLLEEIKLAQQKRLLKTIGRKSPGGTPLKKRKPRQENTMRSALENALLKRFKNVRRDSDSPAGLSPCGSDF